MMYGSQSYLKFDSVISELFFSKQNCVKLNTRNYLYLCICAVSIADAEPCYLLPFSWLSTYLRAQKQNFRFFSFLIMVVLVAKKSLT